MAEKNAHPPWPFARIRLESRLDQTDRLARFLEDFGHAAGLTCEFVLGLNLAIEELFVNAVSYGFPDGRRTPVDVEVWLTDRDCMLRMSDEGRAFDPRTAPPPDLEAPLEGRCVGGLGIHLVRVLVDALDYRRRGRRNIVTLAKRLPDAASAPEPPEAQGIDHD